MPGQNSGKSFQYSTEVSGTSSTTTLNLAGEMDFDSGSGAFSLEYVDEDTSNNEKSLFELRVYTNSSKTTMAAQITFRTTAVCSTSGTVTVTENTTIDPGAVDDTPKFPRNVDHSALRTWAQAVTNGSAVVAQYSASLDVRGDGQNGYTLDQNVLQQGTNTLELEYVVRQGSSVLATGTVQFDTSTTVESPLVAGPVTYSDSFT